MTKAGEALILPDSPATIVDRYAEFLELTRLPDQAVTSTVLVCFPFPKLSRSAGPRGWPTEINPAVLWHPLFWLPQRIAFRYRFDDLDTDTSVETDSEWAVRVALEMTLSGLYDPTDGTWYDPLAAVGLDIDDPAVQARLVAWLHGGADDVLAGIDLTEITDIPDDIDWAVKTVTDLLPVLTEASWAQLADDLAQEAGEISLDTSDVSSAAALAHTIATLAAAVLGDVPPAEGQQKPAELFDEIKQEISAWDSDLDELIEGPVDQLSETLYSIRDAYWPRVEELNAELELEPQV